MRLNKNHLNYLRLFPSIFILTVSFTFTICTVIAHADESFEIKHEIDLPNYKPFNFAINDAGSNSGYIITGYIGGHQAWAGRLDAQGNELWNYSLPKDTPQQYQNVSPAWRSSQFKSAVTLENGNTLLCGNKDIGEDQHPIMMGLLTKVDTKGKFLDQRLLTPHGDTSFRLNYIDQCASWGEGYFVAGSATQFIPNVPGKSPPNVRQNFFWLMALDANGEVKWEKLIDKSFSVSPAYKLPWLVMSNGDLIFSGTAPNVEKKDGLTSFTSVIRVGQDGEVKAQRSISGSMKLVRQSGPAQAIRLVPLNLQDAGMYLLTLNGDLTDASYLKSDKDEFTVNQAIEMQDNSFVLAGAKGYKNPYATLIRYSPDLRKRYEFVFKPIGSSYGVDDAMLTNRQDELVTIRSLAPELHRNLFTVFTLK